MTQATDSRVLLHPDDNIAVAAAELSSGEKVLVAGTAIVLKQRVDIGHKFAIRPISQGERVIKYCAPIGSAILPIESGEYIHTQNLASEYIPTYTFEKGKSFVKDEP